MFVIILVALLITPFAYSIKYITLNFLPSSPQQSFTAYKGSYIDIPVTVVNPDSISITCTISSSLGSSSTNLLPAGSQQTLYFRHNVPNTIKSFFGKPASITFTTDCKTTAAPYTCPTTEFPFLTTCYYDSKPFPHSVNINYVLSDQDQKNFDILEDYRNSLANKITDIDKKAQQINDLISKTPTPILPKGINQDNSNIQQNVNALKSKFQNVHDSLEQEQYNLGSQVDKNSDLISLSNSDMKITDMNTMTNNNIQRYKQIGLNLQNLVSDAKDKSAKLRYMFNNELISKLDEVGKEVSLKINSYKFTDLDDADNLVKTYSDSKDKIINQMQSNLNDYANKAVNLISKQVNKICSDFKLCDTKGKIDEINLATAKDFTGFCFSYDSLSKEVKIFNDKEINRQKIELDELNKKNQEINDKNIPIQKEIDKTKKINDLKQNTNSEAIKVEKDIQDSLNDINLLGKTIDISKYIELVKEYNALDFQKKEAKLKNLEEESKKVRTEADKIKSQENNFFAFFKKLYYRILGSKQELDYKLNLEINETIPKLISELQNNITPAKNVNIEDETVKFFTDSCKISQNQLTQLQANTLNIQTSEKQSDIKTDLKNVEKNCIDENGQRTNKCCDSDEYKSRKDLYPVIFVHGHAAETGQKTVKSSLDTFASMSSYFAQRGYVLKDILYPEKATELTKGSWPYCKPIAVMVTYYEGIMNGGAVQYKNSIGDYAPTLSKEIDAVLTATNKDKAIIVSHSMGGIISRYYILKKDGQSKIYRLITISSPHYGTNNWINFLSNAGESESKEMKPGSPFLNLLNYPEDSLVNTYSIMGDSKACDLGLGQRCDGVIYVEDAKLKNAKDFIVFKGPQYEHSMIVLQQNVSQKVLDIVNT